MSRRNAPSLLSISARPVALGGTLRSPVRARIPISAASVAATPHSQKRREHEKWAKHRSTISGAPNGHRAFQKRHAWSPLGPPTSPERGGELWGPRASGGSDGKISSEFGLIRTWTRDVYVAQLTIEVKSGSMSGEFLPISRHCREVAPFIILRARRAPVNFRAALGRGVFHSVPSWIATFRTACGALVRPVRPP